MANGLIWTYEEIYRKAPPGESADKAREPTYSINFPQNTPRNRSNAAATALQDLKMDRALQFYPFEHLNIVRSLPDNHWFVRQYRQLSRVPTAAELLLPHPPFGLLHDEDYEEEMQLIRFLDRRTARRMAALQAPVRAPASKHHTHHLSMHTPFCAAVLTRTLPLSRLSRTARWYNDA
jgi:hypothetical protein